MNCEEVRKRLPEELAEGDRPFSGAVAEHLEMCPACRAVVQSHREIARTLRGKGLVDPPDELADSIMKRLGDQPADTGAGQAGMRLSARSLGVMLVGGGLLFLSFWYLPHRSVTDQTGHTDGALTAVTSTAAPGVASAPASVTQAITRDKRPD
ncbi:MAG TPA: hypothetical protein PKM25_13730 [Candidatus Ozemobacteraceae bacterium]|nr:hypothetical protein [Candidatus Ozemobacteraceae bacterium]